MTTSDHQLRIALLALLPGDGSAVPMSDLAVHASATHCSVRDALADEVQAGSVRYHVEVDAYSAVKRGDTL